MKCRKYGALKWLKRSLNTCQCLVRMLYDFATSPCACTPNVVDKTLAAVMARRIGL